MKARVTVDEHGGVSIAANLRRAFGLNSGDELIAEGTPNGILLRPMKMLIGLYSEERITEFIDGDALIEKLLPEIE